MQKMKYIDDSENYAIKTRYTFFGTSCRMHAYAGLCKTSNTFKALSYGKVLVLFNMKKNPIFAKRT